MGTLFFGENGGHSLEVVDDLPISASDVRSLQMRLRPGEQWDPKCRPLPDGLAYLAAQADFDGTREYFEKELNKLIADQYKPLRSVDAIPTVELTELKVNTRGTDDLSPLVEDLFDPPLIQTAKSELSFDMTPTNVMVDPLLYAQLFGLPMRVVPKDQCCQPITAVPARPHKKKRIRKKWLKKYGWKIIYGPEKAWIVTDPVEGSQLFVGPDTYKKLKKARIDAKNVRIDVKNVAADD